MLVGFVYSSNRFGSNPAMGSGKGMWIELDRAKVRWASDVERPFRSEMLLMMSRSLRIVLSASVMRVSYFGLSFFNNSRVCNLKTEWSVSLKDGIALFRFDCGKDREERGFETPILLLDSRAGSMAGPIEALSTLRPSDLHSIFWKEEYFRRLEGRTSILLSWLQSSKRGCRKMNGTTSKLARL